MKETIEIMQNLLNLADEEYAKWLAFWKELGYNESESMNLARSSAYNALRVYMVNKLAYAEQVQSRYPGCPF